MKSDVHSLFMYVATLSVLKYKPVLGGYLIVLITAGSVFKYFRMEVLVISKSLKELAILMRELVVIKAVFFSLFFPILLRTVIMNAKNCTENSLGSFFLLFLITTQHR